MPMSVVKKVLPKSHVTEIDVLAVYEDDNDCGGGGGGDSDTSNE